MTFNCGSSPRTITVTSAKEIAVDTTIDGGGLITISGGGSTRVFTVNSGVTVNLNNLTLSGGSGSAISSADFSWGVVVTATNSTFSNNRGGAISVVPNGTVTVTNSTFSNNEGGAIIVLGRDKLLTVSNSTFSNNSATGLELGGAITAGGTGWDNLVAVTNSTFSNNSAYDGGAIWAGVHVGWIYIADSTFSGNSAVRYGGAIFGGGGAFAGPVGRVGIADSTFSGNSAAAGGAAYLTPGGVANSTFSGNSASETGGAINLGGTGTVTNSTFSNNSAGGTGGAVNFSGTGEQAVTNSTFFGNSTPNGKGGAIDNHGTVTLSNTIVANSTGWNCWGSDISDGSHNLDSDGTCGFSSVNGSLSNTNPMLDPAGLADNGGPTQTIALCGSIGIPNASCTSSTASPAINAGNETICATLTGTAPVDNLDQRGFVRPGVGAVNCSIGAYEFESRGPPCVGDCRHDWSVEVSEILMMINIALGNAPPVFCRAGDANGDGQITVDEILAAVNNALNGCPRTPE